MLAGEIEEVKNKWTPCQKKKNARKHVNIYEKLVRFKNKMELKTALLEISK